MDENKGQDFSKQINDETGIIDLGKIDCQEVSEVIQAPLLLELISRVSIEMTDIVAGKLLSEHDFRTVKDIYERVYIKGEKILTKKEYKTLKDFIESDRVKKYFVKLLDEDHLLMSGTPNKTRNLTEEILKINWTDWTKFTPVIECLLGRIKNTQEVEENIVFGYNFRQSHRKQNNITSSQRDKTLQLHSYKTEWKDTYGLVLIQDSKVIESEHNDYTQILDAHECGGVKIMRAKKDSWEWYIGIIGRKIIEISSFDFTDRQKFSEGNPSIAKKNSGRGFVFFDGKKVQELTEFKYKNINKNNSQEKSGLNDIYNLKKEDNTFDVIKAWVAWENILFSDNGIEDVRSFYIHNSIPKWSAIARVRRWKKWGHIILLWDKIQEFGPQDYLKMEAFSWEEGEELNEQICKKDSWYGITTLLHEKIQDVTSFDFINIHDEKEINWLKIRECKKASGLGFIYRIGEEIKEFGYNINKMRIIWGEISIIQLLDKSEQVIQINKNGVEVVGEDSYDKVSHLSDNHSKEAIAIKWWKKQYIWISESGEMKFTDLAYIEIQEFDSDGFSVAQKNSWYGLLKKEDDSVREASNFDFTSLHELEEYRRYALEKKTGYGIADFSKTGIDELTRFEYLSIWEFDTRGFAVAQKDTGFGLLKREQSEVQEVTDFCYKQDSLDDVVSREYWVHLIISTDDIFRFVNFSKLGFSKALDTEFELVKDWEGSGIFYVKEKWWNWGVMTRDKNEITALSKFDFIDLLESIWDFDVDMLQKKSGYGFVRIEENNFTELSPDFDFDYKNSDDIDEEWKYFAKKINGWYGLIEYDGDKIHYLTEFDFDTRWDIDSDQSQTVTKWWKTYVIQNTEKGVDIVADLSQYTEIETWIQEWVLTIAEKSSWKWVVMMVDGQIQEMSEFIYESITDFDWDSHLATAMKDKRVGLLYFDSKKKEVREVKRVGDNSSNQESMHGSNTKSSWENNTISLLNGFVFQQLEIRDYPWRKDQKIVVWKNQDGYLKIFRYHEWNSYDEMKNTLHIEINYDLKDVGEIDDNNVSICRDENDKIMVLSIQQNDIKVVQLWEQEYTKMTLLNDDFYLWTQLDGSNDILHIEGWTKKTDIIKSGLEYVSQHQIWIYEWKTESGIGYFWLKNGETNIHVDFILKNKIRESWLQIISLNSEENIVIWSKSNRIYPLFSGDVKMLEANISLDEWKLLLFSNSKDKWWCFECKIWEDGEYRFEIVVDPLYDRNKLLEEDGKVYLTKEGVFAFWRKDCLYGE